MAIAQRSKDVVATFYSKNLDGFTGICSIDLLSSHACPFQSDGAERDERAPAV